MSSRVEKALRELRNEEAATLKHLEAIRRAKEILEPAVKSGSNGSSPSPKRIPAKKTARRTKPHNSLGPRGIEAADRILKEAGRPLKVREILDEIETRGWIREGSRAPMEATRVALRRLSERGGAKKLSDGRWVTAAKEEGGGS